MRPAATSTVILIPLLAVARLTLAAGCPPLDAGTRTCQAAVAKAGYLYAKAHLSAVQQCLKSLQAGKLAGDPATVCRGSASTPPSDAKTAEKLVKARTKAVGILSAACADTQVAALDLCATTVSALPDCLVADHRQRADEAIGAEYGAADPIADTATRKCQSAIGKESAKYLTARLKAVQGCLNKRNKACGDPKQALARCLGGAPDGTKDEAKTVAKIGKALGKLRAKVAEACTNAQIAALDACGSDTTSLEACTVCTHGNAAELLLAAQYRAVRTTDPGATLAAAAGAAEAGDTLLLQPGTYAEAGVTLDVSGLGVIGHAHCATGARPTLADPTPGTHPTGLAACGSLLPGCTLPADDLLLQGFDVQSYQQAGILTTGARGVIHRDLVALGDGSPTGMPHGIATVLSEDVLIEASTAAGTRAAGIHISQSAGVTVRNSEAFGNGAGIVIENSGNVRAHDNHVHDNGSGIVVLKLPGLAVQAADCNEIDHNVVADNDVPNFDGGLLGRLPRGTGIVLLSADATHLHDNLVAGSGTFGLLLTDQVALDALLAPPPFPAPSPDATASGNVVVDNDLRGNATDPDSAIGAFAPAADASVLLAAGGGGNCQRDNQLATEAGFAALPACPDPAVVSGCPYIPTTTTTTTSSTTTTVPQNWQQIANYFGDKCFGCHTLYGNSGTLHDIDQFDEGYDALVGVPSWGLPTMLRVNPGSSATSYLMHKLDGTAGSVGSPYPNQMPIGLPGGLPIEIRDAIRAWIDRGAPKVEP